MLEPVGKELWGTVEDGQYVLQESDMSTINRPVESNSDYPWSLGIMCQHMKSGDHKVLKTKRSSADDGWLALCET